MQILETKKLTNKTRTLIGSDGGEAVDDYEDRVAVEVREKIKISKYLFLESVRLFNASKKSESLEKIDESLESIKDAFWLADELPIESEPHGVLHEIAKWKHDNFGCYLIKDGDVYIQRCAVAMTHKRIGFSIGSTGTAICEICENDEFSCPHSHDRTYWIEAGNRKDGACLICGEMKCSDHPNTSIYRVRPTFRLKNLVLHEVSIVRKPANRLSHIREMTLTKNDMITNVGAIDEEHGQVYKCDQCAGACLGFTEFGMPS